MTFANRKLAAIAADSLYFPNHRPTSVPPSAEQSGTGMAKTQLPWTKLPANSLSRLDASPSWLQATAIAPMNAPEKQPNEGGYRRPQRRLRGGGKAQFHLPQPYLPRVHARRVSVVDAGRWRCRRGSHSARAPGTGRRGRHDRPDVRVSAGSRCVRHHRACDFDRYGPSRGEARWTWLRSAAPRRRSGGS